MKHFKPYYLAIVPLLSILSSSPAQLVERSQYRHIASINDANPRYEALVNNVDKNALHKDKNISLNSLNAKIEKLASEISKIDKAVVSKQNAEDLAIRVLLIELDLEQLQTKEELGVKVGQDLSNAIAQHKRSVESLLGQTSNERKVIDATEIPRKKLTEIPVNRPKLDIKVEAPIHRITIDATEIPRKKLTEIPVNHPKLEIKVEAPIHRNTIDATEIPRKELTEIPVNRPKVEIKVEAPKIVQEEVKESDIVLNDECEEVAENNEHNVLEESERNRTDASELPHKEACIVKAETSKEEVKEESPTKEETNVVEKDENEDEDKKKVDEARLAEISRQEKLICELETKNNALGDQLSNLMKEQQNILNAIVGLSQMMVQMSMNQQNQAPTNPYGSNWFAFQQSPYQFNQPVMNGNWVYYANGYGPSQPNIFAAPQAQGFYPNQMQQQQQQPQYQTPGQQQYQQSNWNLAPQNYFSDPRYSTQPMTIGGFGSDHFSYNFSPSTSTNG